MTYIRKAGAFFRRREVSLALRLALPPLLTALLLLAGFRLYGIYPFGSRSLAWGDMTQQIVPLLTRFGDVLGFGDDPPFYSLKAGGGMNMYGVFFYYLASPFTLLAAFVRKEDMLLFAGLLVAAKLSVSALTASMCFTFRRKRLGAAETVLLSVMYPFCGFAMLYFQILPWLDIMYLFPLLVISLERLFGGRGKGMYIAVMSACMIVQFYLCGIVALFIMLFSGVYSLYCIKTRSGSRARLERAVGELFTGSAAAALLTAFVWLPSFMQLRASAKTETKLSDVIRASDMVPDIATMLPMLMCCGFAAVVLGGDMLTRRRHSGATRIMLEMLGLTLLPFLLEPVNKLWHFGNYICFPGRFGFITCFLMLYCCADALADRPRFKPDTLRAAAWGIGSVTALLVFLKHMKDISTRRMAELSRYTQTLWGDYRSLRLILGISLLAAAAFGTVYAAYRKGVLPRTVFTVLTASVFVVETVGNMGIYMGAPAERGEAGVIARMGAYSLAGRIEDEGFYRVKTAGKLYDNNLVGSMGYPNLGHYTSLTDSTAAEMLRMMGMSAVGMEISTVGGTRLTDALFSVRYEINGDVSGSERIFRGRSGYIARLPEYLPPGLLLAGGALDGMEELPEGIDRTGVQELLSERLLGGSAVERLVPDIAIPKTAEGKYFLPAGTVIKYVADTPGGEKSLYFDCFDGMSTRFSESYFGSVEVRVNGSVLGLYPTSVNNGTVYLGDINGETEIELRLMKGVAVSSFGVFAVDAEKLGELISRAQTAGLTDRGKGVLRGTVTVSEPKTCLVSLPYSEGLRVRVNGRRVPVKKALGGLTAFELGTGSSEVVISFVPPGLTAGLLLTLAGAGLTAAGIMLHRHGKRLSRGANSVLWTVMTAGSAAVFALIYIMPIIANVFMSKQK